MQRSQWWSYMWDRCSVDLGTINAPDLEALKLKPRWGLYLLLNFWVFNLFLESFEIGSNTKWLLKHLVVICLDGKAYACCLASRLHCYQLYTQGANFTSKVAFMSSEYLDMMHRWIRFLSYILKGFNICNFCVYEPQPRRQILAKYHRVWSRLVLVMHPFSLYLVYGMFGWRICCISLYGGCAQRKLGFLRFFLFFCSFVLIIK